MLLLDQATFDAVAALAYDEAPLEMCGLLAGDPASGRVRRFYPCRNEAASARVYVVDGRDHLRAERDAEASGWELIGVVHSHTHTPAYPSPTDVAAAAYLPEWHYPVLSLADGAAVLRSYRIVAGNITEEAVVVVD